MKYEYQDIIKEELLNQKEKEIDKSTLKTATFNVFRYVFGQYIVNPEYKSLESIKNSKLDRLKKRMEES